MGGRRLFSFLHLSDFHQGAPRHDWLWPFTAGDFRKDLRELHQKCGPWDVVFFTGDLTHSGSREQFENFSAEMKKLWRFLKKLGSNPVLVTVPGNHDLVRPGGADLQLLQGWAGPDADSAFWTHDSDPHRVLVQRAFEEYETWSARHPLRKPRTLHKGLLPGDFACTIDVNGCEVGVLGINTAFLQLTSDPYEGKLQLHWSQVIACCGSDVQGWIDRHHICFLLTHHPPGWLSDPARQILDADIAPPGRFAIHLFGHMHEGQDQSLSRGGGGATRRWQAYSLFGLEKFAGMTERRHGYTAGRIDLTEGGAFLRCWPRRMTTSSFGARRIHRDQDEFTLQRDDGTEPEPIKLKRQLPSVIGDTEPRSLPRRSRILLLAGTIAAIFVLAAVTWAIWRSTQHQERWETPPALTEQARKRSREIDLRAQDIWRDEDTLFKERAPDGKAASDADLDNQLLAIRARRHVLKALMAKTVFSDTSDDITFERTEIAVFIERRGSEFWRSIRIADTFLIRSRPLPFIPHVFDYHELGPDGPEVLCYIYPSGKPELRAAIEKAALGAPRPFEYQSEKTDMSGSTPALAARWLPINPDWLPDREDGFVVETESTRFSKRCLRMVAHFSTEGIGAPTDYGKVQVLVGADDSSDPPRMGYDLLLLDSDDQLLLSSSQTIDEQQSCDDLSGAQWSDAKDQILGKRALQTNSTRGWRCNVKLSRTPELRQASPIFLFYIQPRASGCFSIEESARAVREALKREVRDGGTGSAGR